MIYNISVILIIAIILLLIKAINMYLKNQIFENFDESINEIGDIMNQLPKKLQHKKILQSVENSIDKLIDTSGQRLKNTKIDDQLLNSYLHNIIKSDDENNPVFESSNINTLRPKISSGNINDIDNYNHKMKVLINSKKIKQDYQINKFKYEIDTLLNSVKDVDELKEKLNSI